MNEFDEEYEAGYDEDWEDIKSKSQVKRELAELKELGRSLIALPLKDLNKLDLPEHLLEAVVKAQSMTKGALKRQVGFIGSLIAKEDYEAIQQQFDKLQQPHRGEVKQFHQLEQWRDQLIAGDNSVLDALINQFDDFDIQYVRQLIRNAHKEAKQAKPPKSARQLFQYLQQCQQDQ